MPNLPLKSFKYQQGTSYIEIMTVVFILGLIAGVAIPNLASNDHRKLDIAAEEIVQAIRFARIEAIRTSIPHGMIFNTGSDNAKVYRILSVIPIYDVYHPVSKKIYTLNLKTDAATEDVELQSYGIYYGGSGTNNPYLGFNAYGNPKYSFFGTDFMLDSATITLSYAGHTRVISVAPMTGRVTVQ